MHPSIPLLERRRSPLNTCLGLTVGLRSFVKRTKAWRTRTPGVLVVVLALGSVEMVLGGFGDLCINVFSFLLFVAVGLCCMLLLVVNSCSPFTGVVVYHCVTDERAQVTILTSLHVTLEPKIHRRITVTVASSKAAITSSRPPPSNSPSTITILLPPLTQLANFNLSTHPRPWPRPKAPHR